jgi:hypothetical protein
MTLNFQNQSYLCIAMKNYLLIISLFISGFINGAAPTIHASQLSINNVNCNSMVLNWTSGNGVARVIIAKEDSSTTYTPIDGNNYSANSNFKGSVAYGIGNYIVYNGSSSNFVKVNNLRPGHRYYFTIYEYNDLNNPLYYSSNAPTLFDSTYYINFNFSAIALDSCEKSNIFQIKNNSKSNIPNLKYRFTFYDNSYLDSNNFQKHFNSSGLLNLKLSPITSFQGCPINSTKSIRVLPKKVVTLDFSKLKNDTQYYEGNYFEIRTNPIPQGFPMSNNYLWKFEKDSFSTFPIMRYSYKREGTYNVKLITTVSVNNQKTGCSDTLYTRLVVLHDPFINAVVTPRVHKLDSNLFIFINIDNSVIKQIWYFDDGDSSLNASTQHSYTAVGTYHSKLYVETNFGYKGYKSFTLYVLNTDFAFAQFRIRKIPDLFKSNMHTFSHKESLVQKQTWYFGDGDSSNLDSCSHRYQTPGIFNGYLKTTLIGGTVYTKYFQIEIIDDANNITNMQNQPFKLYPNPAAAEITIEIPEASGYQSLRIFNALGESVYIQTQLEISNTIDLNTIPAGIYFIELMDKEGRAVRKRLVIGY